ncbi:Cell surface A33 antigen [Aix galericulata]|nr:Cell surface A33 antigen [Aix galericulata]
MVTAHTLTVETPAKELQVARGSNATLRCQFNTDASITAGDFVVWKKINTAYGKGYENRIQFTGNLGSGDISITINEVTMEDNGTYICSVRLRNDPPRQSAVTSLYVLIAPSKPECKIVGTAEYGQTINLTCISHEGSPKPTYSWESFNVQHEPRVLQTTKGEQITLKNISADTSGFYICTSTNIVGKESCNMTVSVVPQKARPTTSVWLGKLDKFTRAQPSPRALTAQSLAQCGMASATHATGSPLCRSLGSCSRANK